MAVAVIVAGIDEAGRGPLAGPVVAAGVILCEGGIVGLDDSKKLTAKRRAVLEGQIKDKCIYHIEISDISEIESLNILWATMAAMRRCADALADRAEHFLVDGNRLPDWSYSAAAVIGGDGIHPCISAASILAKEHRDRIMVEAAKQYPQYGWERNKGYGTPDHMAALQKYGPTPLHRKNFSPIAQLSIKFEEN